MRYVEYDVVPVTRMNGIMLKKSKYFVTLAKSQFKVQVMVKIESTSLHLSSIVMGL